MAQLTYHDRQLLDNFFGVKEIKIKPKPEPRREMLIRCSKPLADEYYKLLSKMGKIPLESFYQIGGEVVCLPIEVLGLWLNKWKEEGLMKQTNGTVQVV